MRILITGSRDWSHYAVVAAVLGHAIAPGSESDTVIVHGACPSGVDQMAADWARDFGVRDEPHPADWDTHGKAAGPLRNQAMVNLGADVCFAFPKGASRGTRDCMRRASAAGIPTINYGDAS